MKIPLLDLKAQYRTIEDEINRAVIGVLESGNYIMGDNVKAFEEEIASYLGVKHAISVANGTDALVITLNAFNLGPGDEVITSPFTFFASAECISRVGAIPVFADVDAETFNIKPTEIEKKITKRTKAIIPVHVFGRTADMDKIMELAQENGIIVIEDACQAIGAEYKGKKIGSIGNAGCFSFFPTKNLGCYGDGGLIVTNDDIVAEKIKLLRTHGSKEKYLHSQIGYNSRLDEIQAAVLRVKLRYIDKWNDARKKKAKMYNDMLNGRVEKIPKMDDEKKNVFHLYTILALKRDELKAFLEKKGISTGVYYPLPLHLQEVYRGLGYKEGDMPVAEEISKKAISLPLYPELEEKHIRYIASQVINFYERR